jgi:hypothetical protein
MVPDRRPGEGRKRGQGKRGPEPQGNLRKLAAPSTPHVGAPYPHRETAVCPRLCGVSSGLGPPEWISGFLAPRGPHVRAS